MVAVAVWGAKGGRGTRLAPRAALSAAVLDDDDDEDGDDRGERHHPADGVRPRRVDVRAVVGRLVLHEAEDEDALQAETRVNDSRRDRKTKQYDSTKFRHISA